MSFLNLIQGYFIPSSITCVNSMEVSYIPIAKARGFTTHWIKKGILILFFEPFSDSFFTESKRYFKKEKGMIY